jgi:alginate O-acetyltransferase complex protein AlgI
VRSQEALSGSGFHQADRLASHIPFISRHSVGLNIMLFSSPEYIFLFLPLVALGYFLLNRYRLVMTGKAWLVLASLFFYGYWEAVYLILILSSILINYSLGTALHRTRPKPHETTKKHHHPTRRSILIGGIAFNLGLLGYFKYADFFIANINAWSGTSLPLLNLLLPLAISFFTFQQIAYLVDCYQQDTQEYDFLNYCLFVTFFPQLIAGPIVHHREMMPQFMRLRNKLANWKNILLGSLIFAMGLFKKIVIADTFAGWADAGFANPADLSFIQAWGASLSYTFQLYYDFSGYSDMAIGAALIFNIRLPINFNSPYKALSIQDFWRRWHITLSRWLRDYVYIPLGGNRHGNWRTHINLLLTFLLGGLWHGAGWTFILWGALHGSALIIHRLWQALGLRLWRWAAWALTFLFINMTWVFFRAEDVDKALTMLRRMADIQDLRLSFQFLDLLAALHVPLYHWFTPMATPPQVFEIALIAALLALLAVTLSRNTMHYLDDWLHDRPRLYPIHLLGYGLMMALALLMLFVGSSQVFLYYNF